MFRTLWLTFAQAVTIGLALLFIVSTIRPEWLPGDDVPTTPTPLAPPGPTLQREPQSTAREATGAILSYAQAARSATPAVVNIFTTKEVRVAPDHPLFNDPLFRRFFGEQFSQSQQTSSLGSGVLVSADGLILTNHHVVESPDEIEVLLADGRRAKARLVGSDPDTDLAVLRISQRNLPVISFGDDKQASIGDVVLAIGNPFGVGQTVTMGIVSALGRNQLGINTFENFIQTDAAINPGNSGGALVDTQGRLLGINTAIYSRSGGSMGIGFAIPVSTARLVLEQIVATGSVTRGYIGVEPQDVTPELADAFRLVRNDGAIIAGVMRGGPADRAGVKIGDILYEVEGQAVPNTAAMLNLIAQLKPGNSARFRFMRGERRIDLNIVVGKRPKPARQN